jgi:hypothetical protein
MGVVGLAGDVSDLAARGDVLASYPNHDEDVLLRARRPSASVMTCERGRW